MSLVKRVSKWLKYFFDEVSCTYELGLGCFDSCVLRGTRGCPKWREGLSG